MNSKDIKGIGEVTILKNDSVSAVFDSFGAKCLAIVKNGENILFYDESDIGHSGIPLCFPSFGPLDNNEFRIDGRAYPMKQHGFIRDNECKKVNSASDQVTYQMTQNEDSLSRFPFDFTFEVTYKLLENGLKITTSMRNDADHDMPLSPGVHPYFAVDKSDNVQFTTKAASAYNNLAEYKEESVEKSEYLEVVSEDCGIKTVKVLGNPDHHMPKHGQETLSILRDGQAKIKLKTDLEAYKLMTVWRKAADSKFICLEPANVRNGLNVKPQWIAPGSSFEASVSIY